MFIGHAPASYIWTRLLARRGGKLFGSFSNGSWIIHGMIAGLLPDLDLFYFYLFDGQSPTHHVYWTHIPFFWLIVFGLWLLVSIIVRSARTLGLAILFGSNILLHMLLDTVSAGIRWMYPFSPRDFVLFVVPPIYDWWVWNFLFHWTFLIELVIVMLAVYVAWSNLSARPAPTLLQRKQE